MVSRFIVPPQSIIITTLPDPAMEGDITTVTCEVGRVKPADGVLIQVFMGDIQLPSKESPMIVHYQGEVAFMSRRFHATFIMYVFCLYVSKKVKSGISSTFKTENVW